MLRIPFWIFLLAGLVSKAEGAEVDRGYLCEAKGSTRPFFVPERDPNTVRDAKCIHIEFKRIDLNNKVYRCVDTDGKTAFRGFGAGPVEVSKGCVDSEFEAQQKVVR